MAQKKNKTVYLLRNTDTGEVEYVGCTQNPKRRIFQHTRVKPGYSKGEGKFYGRTDLELVPVKEFDNKPEAVRYEVKLKKQYGFNSGEWEALSKEVKIYDFESKSLVKIYPSLSSASKELNVNVANLQKTTIGKYKHTKGYYAIYS